MTGGVGVVVNHVGGSLIRAEHVLGAQRLGYRLIEEVPDEPEAPAEVGLECRWRLTREQWLECAFD